MNAERKVLYPTYLPLQRGGKDEGTIRAGFSIRLMACYEHLG